MFWVNSKNMNQVQIWSFDIFFLMFTTPNKNHDKQIFWSFIDHRDTIVYMDEYMEEMVCYGILALWSTPILMVLGHIYCWASSLMTLYIIHSCHMLQWWEYIGYNYWQFWFCVGKLCMVILVALYYRILCLLSSVDSWESTIDIVIWYRQ